VSLEGPLLADGEGCVPGPEYRQVDKKRTQVDRDCQLMQSATLAAETTVYRNEPCIAQPKTLGSAEHTFAPNETARRTIMERQDGGVKAWDARAEYDVGVLISRYLHEESPPAGSVLAPRLAAIAQDFQAAGELDLARLGASHLRVLPVP
jgi:hypothetical protein